MIDVVLIVHELIDATVFISTLAEKPEPCPEDEEPDAPLDVDLPIETSDRNDESSSSSETIADSTELIGSSHTTDTSSDELEDILEIRPVSIPTVAPPVEDCSALTELRTFLSEIEEDTDTVDNEPQPERHIEPLDEIDDNPIDISDDPFPWTDSLTQETVVTAVAPSDDLLFSPPSPEEKQVKRYSTVNYYTLPLGTKVSYISCSSTYVYVCTIDRRIFYGKLPSDETNSCLHWQQYSEYGDQLVVSITNRTVWRLLSGRLYASRDPLKFPPIGSRWTEIKTGSDRPPLSMSINDQCGW